VGDSNRGAAWVYTRSGGVWTQQGNQLVGTGAVGDAVQGFSVALDGNTAIVGGPGDNSNRGAAWVYTRSGGVWTQQGNKLVGSGVVGGGADQGISVGLSADGATAIVGGPFDSGGYPGAAWVFVQGGMLQVSPTTNIAASGIQGQLFSPTSFNYQLASTSGSVHYSISGIPSWLDASFTSGMVPPPVTVTFSLNACGFGPGTYPATITFTNTSTGQGNTTRTATLTVNPGTKNDCKDRGLQKFTCSPGPFKNQGQCVSYFATQ
jgi:hypothetical protein